ncbi:MAG: tripartite tricarboxylate transporter TctB family protein [Desulfatiglandales bacterium]|jgi:hypothetical protein|nr:tripartite tricarboxylate transporter TctB family protein [Desulfatiglandales bacterium]
MRRGRLGFMVFLLILDLAFLLTSFSYDPQARMMPLAIGTAALLMIVLILVNEVHPLRMINAMDFSVMDELVEKKGGKIGSQNQSAERVFGLIVWISGLFILIFLAGFHVGIVLFTLMYLKFKSGTTWPKAILGSGLFWALIFIVFEMAMKFTLFKGLFFDEIVPRL